MGTTPQDFLADTQGEYNATITEIRQRIEERMAVARTRPGAKGFNVPLSGHMTDALAIEAAQSYIDDGWYVRTGIQHTDRYLSFSAVPFPS